MLRLDLITDVSGYGDEEEDSSESETDIREEANFTQRWEQSIGVSAQNVHPCYLVCDPL